jgi:hypothetical protein
MVLGSGAFGRQLGPEDGALLNGISALMKGISESSPTHFPPDKKGKRNQQCTPEEALTRTNQAGT